MFCNNLTLLTNDFVYLLDGFMTWRQWKKLSKIEMTFLGPLLVSNIYKAYVEVLSISTQFALL